MLCKICKQHEAPGKEWMVTFNYEGMIFSIKRFGAACLECEKKPIINKYLKYCRGLVKPAADIGLPEIDWQIYLDLVDFKPTVYDYDMDISISVTEILMAVGIFSRQKSGHWEIREKFGGSLNPHLTCIPLYFVRKEDAVAVARLKWKEHPYDWEIVSYGEVTPSKEVLGKI